MSREKTLIVGNWKMHLNVQEASLYLHKLENSIKVRRDVEVVLAPTMLALQTLSLQVNLRQFKLAAQNLFWRDYGAYTGEVSATQLRGIVQYAIIGHSERRNSFGETDKGVRAKVQAAVRNNITPIMCIGETTQERTYGETDQILFGQVTAGLANVTSEELENVVIAYEPVWAIGTGVNAKPDDVVKAIKAIRGQIKHLYGATAARNIRVLYGGSVTAESAPSYLALEEVDGLLVGGASLDAHAFSSIAASAHKIEKE